MQDDERMGAPSSRGRPRKHVRDRRTYQRKSGATVGAGRGTPLSTGTTQIRDRRMQAQDDGYDIPPQQQSARFLDDGDDGDAGVLSGDDSDRSGIDMEEMLERLHLPVWGDDDELSAHLDSSSMKKVDNAQLLPFKEQNVLRADYQGQDTAAKYHAAWSAEFSALENLLRRASMDELCAVPYTQCHIFGLSAEELSKRGIESALLKWRRLRATEDLEKHAHEGARRALPGPLSEENVGSTMTPDLSVAVETLNNVDTNQYSHEPDDFDSFLDEMGA